MRQALESSYPYVIGVLGGLVYYFTLRFDSVPQNFESLLSAVISISALAVGFIITARSILVATEGSNRFMRAIQQQNRTRRLWGYFSSAVRFNFIIAVYSCILLLMGFNPGSSIHQFVIALWVTAALTALGTLFRVTNLFLQIMDGTE